MKEKLFHVGVKALIEDEQGRVLLLKAPAWEKGNIEAHWDIPGGRIQEGGDVADTLEREIKEETGINRLESSKFITAVISNHQIKFEDQMLGLVLMIYEVKVPSGGDVTLSHEHTAFEWVSKKEAAERLSEKYPPEFTEKLPLL
ncbi:NUDIX hydrolase [Candidatus Saccharibacteria bacterium]|jgi:8-oxo-dGTP pyrophosphatase MutT (NUDIX family)|nr:NUDIX hydrolase [Candidatus Saccharibacteria bacterium]